MCWTNDHDTLFLREVLCVEPWLARQGSPERGQVWEIIAANLNSLEEPYFKVTQRSVRDRYNLLAKKYKQKWNSEDMASGINPEHTEIDDALRDIIERFDEADEARAKLNDEKKCNAESDLCKAKEIRQLSLETFGESSKRKDIDDVENSGKKQKRRSSCDTITYLTEKSQRDHELRKEELKLKERELEIQKNAQVAQSKLLQQQTKLIMALAQKLSS